MSKRVEYVRDDRGKPMYPKGSEVDRSGRVVQYPSEAARRDHEVLKEKSRENTAAGHSTGSGWRGGGRGGI